MHCAAPMVRAFTRIVLFFVHCAPSAAHGIDAQRSHRLRHRAADVPDPGKRSQVVTENSAPNACLKLRTSTKYAVGQTVPHEAEH